MPVLGYYWPSEHSPDIKLHSWSASAWLVTLGGHSFFARVPQKTLSEHSLWLLPIGTFVFTVIVLCAVAYHLGNSPQKM